MRRITAPIRCTRHVIGTRRSNGVSACLMTGLLLLVAAPLWAQIGLSPPKLDITIDESGKPSAHSIRVVNFGDEEVEVQVVVHNWDMDESNTVRILPPTEQSLDQWMAISPLRFTIPPEGSQVVRFSVRPLVEPEPGEHRAMLFFEQVPPEQTGPEIRFIFRMGAAVYGQVGETIRIGKLHSAQADGYSAQFDISSIGTANVRFDGQYAVWPADLYPGAEQTQPIDGLESGDYSAPGPIIEAGTLPPTAVLPGTRRVVDMNLREALDAGDYVLDLNGSLGETPIDLAVPFSSTGEQVQRVGLIRGAEVKGAKVKLLVMAKGTARVRLEGQYAVWRAQAFPGADKTALIDLSQGDAVPEDIIEIGPLPDVAVMPRDRRVVEFDLRHTLPPGDYVLDVNGRLGETVVNRALPFSSSVEAED